MDTDGHEFFLGGLMSSREISNCGLAIARNGFLTGGRGGRGGSYWEEF